MSSRILHWRRSAAEEYRCFDKIGRKMQANLQNRGPQGPTFHIYIYIKNLGSWHGARSMLY